MKLFSRPLPSPKRNRPLIEPLEARIAPAANAWIGVASGNWNTASNWSDGVPTADDVVTINPAGTLTITIDAGVQAVASLSMPGDDALSITGGSLAVTAASVIHNLALGGSGSLFASAAVSLTGVGSFSGAAILGGSSVVTNNGTLGITSGEPDLATELVNANGATIQHGNAFLDLNGAAAKVRVAPGGLYETVNTGNGFSFRASGSPQGVFVEAGAIFRHNTPNGAVFNIGAGVPFDVNGGTVQNTGVTGTALNLNGISTFTNATLAPSLNTTINFSGNSNTVVGTITGSGAGLVNLAAGQLHATAAGATLNFPAGLFNWSGSGSLSGPGVFTNTGTIQMTGGEPDLATELLNLGTIQHGNAFLDLDGAAAKLRLVPGGLYESVNTGNGFGFRALNGTQGVFIEAGGMFRHNTPNAAVFNIGAGVPFNVNAGTVQNTGFSGAALNLDGIGTFTNASLVPSVGTTINFSGNSNTIIGTVSGSGAGVVNLASGQLHATAAGAALNFPAGLFNWSGSGSLSGPGVFTNTGTIQMTGGEPDLATELLNLGTIQHGNAFLDLDGAAAKLRLVSGGLYEAVNTSSSFGFRAFNGTPGVFVETGGVFRHNSSNGATFDVGANVPFDVNGGTLQNTGVAGTALNLNGIGTFTNATLVPSVGTTINFSGNNNTVIGTITGSGAGVVNLATGQLHATAAGATLNFPAGLFNLSGTGSLSGPGVFTNTGKIQVVSGEPDLATDLVNAGTIQHSSAFLDLVGAGKLRVIAGGLYEAVNTSSNFGFRAFGGTTGVFVEAGGVLRHNSPNGATFNVGADVPFTVNSGTLQNTGVAGTALILNGIGTFTNASFAPSLNTAINFSGDNNTIVGTLTGTGTGKVNLNTGQLHATTAGGTLNFPAGMFDLSGTGSLSGPGIFTNKGAIQITSGEPNLATELVNAGTIQHFSAFFDLDGAAAKVRVVSGGLYESVNTSSGFGFRATNGTPGVFVEAGATFRHNPSNGAHFSVGTGTPFSNLGTVTVANGALNFTTLPAQISGTAGAATLTGGAWEVASGGTLNLGITGLAANAATIIVRGTGSFTGLAALGANIGSLSLLEGADLTKTTALTSSGALTLSAGTVFTTPAFTQTQSGITTFELGGTAAAQIGRLVVTGAATLGGTAHFQIVNGFAPAAGQTLTPVTFGFETSNSTRITGLGLGLGRSTIFEVVNTGTALTLNSLVNAADLAAQSVTTPVNTNAGANIALSYTVQNVSANPTLGTAWTDTVYLSLDGTLDSSDIVLTRVAHSGAVAGGGSYTENLNVPLIGALPANYKIIVVADSQGRVPDPARANNFAASAGTFALDIPTLTPGVAFNGTIANNRDQYFQVTLPAGQSPTFTFTGAGAGAAELYESLNAVPTRATFFESAFVATSTVQRIVGDTTSAATYFILVHGRENAGAGQTFSLVANGAGFDLTGTSVAGGPAIGEVTTTLTGSQFTPATTFTLVSGGTTRAASATYFTDARTVSATFDLTGLALGSYDIVADNGAATDALPGAFTVNNGAAGKLFYTYSSPRYIRPPFGEATVLTISYENTGGTDIDAPLFTLLATNARLRLAGDSTFLQATYQTGGQPLAVYELLGVSDGLAGVLQPGEKGRIDVVFEPISSVTRAVSNFEVIAAREDGAPFSLAGLKTDLQPAGVSNDAWDAIFANLQSAAGTTVGSYKSMLADNANYLGQLGKVSPDTTRLLQFELTQAGDFGAIAAHYADGAFGRGSAGLFNTRILVESGGNLTLTDGTSSAFFLKQANGSFSTGRADGSVLTRAATGAVTILAADGSKTTFRASDGRIDFLEDSNGNRVTATYNAGGQLTKLTEALTGDATNFTYNAAGDVATRTDAVGRVATYTYDAGGQHLVRVTSPQGAIDYTYVTGQGAAREHALASVTGFDGVTTSYAYDALGRLVREQVGSGAGAIVENYAYDSAGKFTATDGAGKITTTFRTALGQVARAIDADGDVTSAAYDASGRLVSLTDPLGLKSKSIFGANGLLEGSIAADKTKTSLTFGDLRRVTSVTDAGGDVTQLGYDARGNLLSKILPDGSTDRLEYDTAGRVIAATDANGERTTFTYNAAGLLTTKQFASGENVTFTYDAHRNLLTATNDEGVTTFTYDAADRVTSAAYPNGKSVAITYDSAGRQATIADQSGYTVRYHYDALSRLDEVRDTGNALLVSYTYDVRGQLATETRANGSTTAYTYDGEGRAATITHRDAANAVTGFFNYTHDAVRHVKTVATEDGTTTYTYDVNGQLTRVELPGGRSIEYRYDEEGNRTAVVDSQNGTTNYTTNSGDQYTSAGAETLTYDGAGRLIASQTGGANTSLGYDAAGRLTSAISAGTVIDYVFDALGNRIAKIENGVRTDFAINPTGLGTLFGEYQGAATVANYAQGLGVAVRTAGGSTAFYQYDAIGNTSLVSGVNGAAVATYEYLPFGEISAQTGALAQPLTFGGRLGVLDDAGDTFYMRARTYDAGLGRFTTRDPIDLRGGDTNLYRFVHNDPINASDPTGLLPFGGALPPGLNLPARPVQAAVQTGLGLIRGQGAGSGTTGLVRTGLQSGLRASGAFAGTPAPIGPIAPPPAPVGPPPVPGAAASIGAIEALGPGLILFGTAALAIDGGETLFNGVFPNAGKLAEQDVVGRSVKSLSERSGASELFTDLVKVGLESGKSERDAILDAITFLRKNGIEDPLFNPNPNNPTPTSSEVVRPSDPNNIVGPAGAGADVVPDIIAPGQTRFDGFVSGGGNFPYRIEFENMPSATAPAQVVRVTQTLDPDLDLSTFAFTGFGFGANLVTANGTSFHTIFDATATLGVLVKIDADLNTLTGLLDVTYTSLDPATNDVPLDPFTGFLPPDDATGRGDGFLTYNVQPKAALANGTAFTGIASIVFDTEDAIATPTVTNTLDSVAPTATVGALPASTNRSTFVVRWTGADNVGGSGLAGITLSFTDNGGPRQTATVANADGGFRFPGEVGHTYAFFSQAVDNVGNTSALPLVAEETITVVAPTFVNVGASRTFVDADGDRYTIRKTGPGAVKVALLDPDGDGRGAIDFLHVDGSTAATAVSVTVVKGAGGNGRVDIGDVTINGALKSFVARQSELVVNGFTATRAVGAIALGSVLQPDALLADPTIKVGGAASSALSVSAVIVADDFKLQTPGRLASFVARSIGDGFISARSIGAIQTNAGDLAADITSLIGIGRLTVKGGDLSGEITARSIGAVSVTGGDFSGEITSLTSATSLGITPAIASLAISGGDFTGDLRVLGSTGAITVSALRGIGGNMTGGTINAARIASLIVGKNVASSTILAGADLGADHALGGIGLDVDTFGRGAIGPIAIVGSVTSSVIGAGLNPTNGIFHDSPTNNDTIVAGIASRIASLTIRGTASADSYFAAGRFTAPVKVAGLRVIPASDARFFVG